MLLKDQMVKRPEKTKLYKRGNNRYVFHIRDTYKKEGNKYLSEDRVCVGKMIDEENMIPNDVFSKYYPGVVIEKEAIAPVFSDTISVGAYTLINSVIHSTYIDDILTEIFVDDAGLIKDLISYIVTNESCAFEYYPYYARKNIIYSSKVYSDSTISKLLKEQISRRQIETFLDEWNKLNKDINDVYINVDSTNFNVASNYDGLSDFGYAKDDKDKPQVNLSYLTRADNHRPLAYDLYNGSINDTGEIVHLLNAFNKYGYQNIGFIFDRGYYSLELVKKLKKEERFFIVMLKENYDYVSDVIKANKEDFINPVDNYIAEYELSYVTKHVNISKSKIDKVYAYVHVFYDAKRAADQKMALLSTIETQEKEIKKLFDDNPTALRDSYIKYEKYFDFVYTSDGYLLSYKRSKNKIKETTNDFGYFALLSSKDISAKEVIATYRSRDSIEKLFRALKSSFEFDHPGVHYKSSLESKVFITFLAMIIRNEISIKLRQLSIQERKQFTFPYVINELNTIEASRSNDNFYYRKYAFTARQKKILGFYSLKEKDIEASISELNNKLSKTK